jgi:hypothetical protein
VGLSLRRSWLQVGSRRIDLGGIEGGSPARPTPEEASREATRTLGPALAGATLIDPGHTLLRSRHVSLIVRDIESAGTQPVILHLDLRLYRWTYSVAATVPVRPGASFRVRAGSGKVLDVEADTNRGTIRMREVAEFWASLSPEFTRYLVRNRRLNQAVLAPASSLGSFGGYGSQMAMLGLPVSQPLSITWTGIDLDRRRMPLMAEPPAAWLADAELVAMRVQMGPGTTRTIEVRDFKLAQ